VDGGFLLLVRDEQLLRIRLGVGLLVVLVSIADGKDNQTPMGKVVAAEIGDIPTKHIVLDLLAVLFLLLPNLRGPIGKLRYLEVVTVDKGDSLVDEVIYF